MPNVSNNQTGLNSFTNFERPRLFIEEEFNILGMIGYGGDAEVFKIKHKRSGEIYALKKIRDDSFVPSEDIVTELDILSNLKHQNIIKLIGALADEGFNFLPLVLEYAPYNLDNIRACSPLSHNQIGFLMKQILQALDYLHDEKVIHKDITPRNILVNEKGVLKLIDFGMANKSTASVVHMRSGERYGTVSYRSIEIALAPWTYTRAIDIWALGCVFAKLITGRTLFPASVVETLLDYIFSICGTPSEENFPEISKNPKMSLWNLQRDCPNRLKEHLGLNVPKEALQLIKRMLSYNPRSRISAKGALKHSYIERFGNNYDCKSMAQWLKKKSRLIRRS